MIIQKEGECRKDYLLRVVVEFIDSSLNPHATVDYDDSTCDGYCLMDDIRSELGID